MAVDPDGPPLQKKCDGCGVSHDRSGFSGAQWKGKGKTGRKCLQCIPGSAAIGGAEKLPGAATRTLSDVGRSSHIDTSKTAIQSMISQLAVASQTDRSLIDEGSTRLWIMESANNSTQEKWSINLHADLIVMGTEGTLEVAPAATGWSGATASVRPSDVAVFEKAAGPWLFRVAEGCEKAQVIVVSIQERVST